ncbi:MAG: hypothetical protein HON43_07700 [Alphaproteobacteria bacterium]|jgi:hypothetical protein|nr:hypothetical protein [Alphaproteobacteria bacterium]MBT5389205.1 hypothetical protein [Alphaproteobacteria bacterium]
MAPKEIEQELSDCLILIKEFQNRVRNREIVAFSPFEKKLKKVSKALLGLPGSARIDVAQKYLVLVNALRELGKALAENKGRRKDIEHVLLIESEAHRIHAQALGLEV